MASNFLYCRAIFQAIGVQNESVSVPYGNVEEIAWLIVHIRRTRVSIGT
jgi:hypothetical protein